MGTARDYAASAGNNEGCKHFLRRIGVGFGYQKDGGITAAIDWPAKLAGIASPLVARCWKV